MTSIILPERTSMYPPLLGDQWGAATVVAWAYSSTTPGAATIWVELLLPNGATARLGRIPAVDRGVAR